MTTKSNDTTDVIGRMERLAREAREHGGSTDPNTNANITRGTHIKYSQLWQWSCDALAAASRLHTLTRERDGLALAARAAAQQLAQAESGQLGLLAAVAPQPIDDSTDLTARIEELTAALDAERRAHLQVHGVLSTARQRVAAAERRATEAEARAESVEQREVSRANACTLLLSDELQDARREATDLSARLTSEQEAHRATDREAHDARRRIERLDAEIAALRRGLAHQSQRAAAAEAAPAKGKAAERIAALTADLESQHDALARVMVQRDEAQERAQDAEARLAELTQTDAAEAPAGDPAYWWRQAKRWQAEAELNAHNPNWREPIRLAAEVKRLERVIRQIPHGADIEAAQDALDGLRAEAALEAWEDHQTWRGGELPETPGERSTRRAAAGLISMDSDDSEEWDDLEGV